MTVHARITLLALSAALATPQFFAADITLTPEIIDSCARPGLVDFALPTLGRPPHAIPNNLGPGDTIFIAAHTRKYLRFQNITQGTADKPVTLTNTGGQLIITADSPHDQAGGGLALLGVRHVILKGTSDPVGAYHYGIVIARTRTGVSGLKLCNMGSGDTFIGADNVEITGIEFGHTGFAGIIAKCELTTAEMPPGYVMTGLNIHHNFIHDTAGEGLYIGWTSPGHHDMRRVSIHHNRILRAGWDGIQLNTCIEDGLIYNNTITGYGLSSHTATDELNNPYTWQNEGLSIGKCAVRIYNNWIQAGNACSGSALSLFPYGDTHVYNNVFILGHYGGATPDHAIYINQAPNLTPLPGATLAIDHNTLIAPNHHGLAFTENFKATLHFRNNLIVAPATRPGIAAPAHATLVQSGNSIVPSLAAVRFVDAANGNYHLAPDSPVLNTGTDNTGVTVDFDGVPRPQGLHSDPGAYETRPL